MQKLGYDHGENTNKDFISDRFGQWSGLLQGNVTNDWMRSIRYTLHERGYLALYLFFL